MFNQIALQPAYGLRGGVVLPFFRRPAITAFAVTAALAAFSSDALSVSTECASGCSSKPLASISSMAEIAEDGGSIRFTVSLSATSESDTAIDFDTEGTATVETDFDPVTGRFHIPAGQTQGHIDVTLIDDRVAEAAEDLTITLTPTEDVDVAQAVATTTITDNDDIGLELRAGSLEVSEDGTTQIGEISVALNAAPAEPVVVTVSVEDETEVRTDITSATFTSDNWNEPQNIIVRGVADGEKDGDQNSKLLVAVASPIIATSQDLPTVDVKTIDAEGETRAVGGEPAQAQAFTHRFMSNRLNMLAGNEPVLYRLSKRGKGGVGSNAINVVGENGNIEGNFAVSAAGVASALDRRKSTIVATADLPNTEELVSDWNLWSEGQFGFYQNKGGVVDTKGDFFVGYLGLDYRVGENTVLGLMGEVDWMESREQGSINEIDGNGFLVGPYISSEIASNIFFDARALWGLSDNDATQDVAGTVFTGEFQTERILLEAKLAGQHDIESLRITPEVAVLYTADDQSAYTISDGLGGTVAVPGQTVELGRASAGLTLTHLGQMGGYSFEPFIGGKLNWDFENPDATTNDLKAALSTGFTLKSDTSEFGVQATWDGVGSDGYEGISGKLTFGHAF